ncbi:MAG: flagellar motor protein MotB [Candidatus Hydrogenedentes bacterium]|nr:flagellar motor protein MotB [Candidatus Hydrogenedentota bacterium]
MARREKKPQAPPPGAPLWVLTYSDLVTLLMGFFVLMLAYSQTDAKKASEAINSIRGALGLSAGQLSAAAVVPARLLSTPPTRRIERIARELQGRLQVRGQEKDVKIEFDARGAAKITMPSQVLFDTAQAELKPEAAPILTDIAQLLSGVHGLAIEVRGYTDSRPLINTTVYKDNYDLSYARAKTVTMHLNATGSVSLDEFEVIAQGPSHPAATNDTEDGRQANRRVELYVRDENARDDTMKALTERVNTAEPPALAPGAPTVTPAPAAQ